MIPGEQTMLQQINYIALKDNNNIIIIDINFYILYMVYVPTHHNDWVFSLTLTFTLSLGVSYRKVPRRRGVANTSWHHTGYVSYHSLRSMSKQRGCEEEPR